MENKNYAKGQNDIFGGVILCIFSVVYFCMAMQIKIMKMLAATFLNASSIPKMWGVLLFVLGAAMIVRGVRTLNKEKADGYVPPGVSAADWAKGWFGRNSVAMMMFIVLGAYIFLIQPLGFLISTFLFLWAEFNVLSRKNERKIVVTGILALVCAVIVYGLFRYAFTMPLPQGILKGIF